ncbi:MULTISPECIES: hypothetical protein [Clostridia]|uniref:hypothetical protein n=1 Tax=Clostridia TaxID=186801 RepID=UPI000EA0C2ED|nr:MULTISPECIES: hypothetical protein [Clostridia]NBJ71530.1 hypothetical protein [Roseburia sp. 1XD42-34]RKI74280.1 hypothetical protein D7V87_19110 [Clostridium sp. 1xD42-85]
MQTYASKRLVDKISKILTSVVAVEETSGGRTQAITEVFLHTVWNNDETSVQPDPLKHYAKIVENKHSEK